MVLTIYEAPIARVERAEVPLLAIIPLMIRKKQNVLCHEEEHDSVKRITTCVFEDETQTDAQRVQARQRAADVDTKDAERDEEQDDQREEKQYLVQRLESYADVPHAPAERPALLVHLQQRRFDLCSRYIAIIIFVEHSERALSFLLCRESRLKVRRHEVVPRGVPECVVDTPRQTFRFVRRRYVPHQTTDVGIDPALKVPSVVEHGGLDGLGDSLRSTLDIQRLVSLVVLPYMSGRIGMGAFGAIGWLARRRDRFRVGALW